MSTDTQRTPDSRVWQPIDTAPEDKEIMTCIDADTPNQRNEQELVRRGRMWWFADASMYVYYTPTHWRPL